MNPRLILVALLIVASQGCGSGGQTSNSPCPMSSDNVAVRYAVINVDNVTMTPSVCQTVKDGTDIQATAGGIADGKFRSDGRCNLLQLPAAVGTALKTADFTTRPPGGGLLHVVNGQFQCTLTSTGPLTLCGQGTLFPDGINDGVLGSCNNDPTLSLAVFRGSVTLRIDALSPPKQFRLTSGQALNADLTNGTITQGAAQFSKEQLSLFDAQLDSLLGAVSLNDPLSMVKVGSLSPSDFVVAPNLLQSQLGRNYGSIGLMCSAINVPVLFYPANPSANTPRLYGGVCSNKTATVYGVAIYRPGQFALGGQFFKETGGVLLRSEIFAKPVTLEFGSTAQLLPWDGSISGSPLSSSRPPTPVLAARGVYIAKFVYDLPPDTTPRIGLVVISLFGAPYPLTG